MQPLPPRPVANRKGESAGGSAESLEGQKRANNVQETDSYGLVELEE